MLWSDLRFKNECVFHFKLYLDKKTQWLKPKFIGFHSWFNFCLRFRCFRALSFRWYDFSNLNQLTHGWFKAKKQWGTSVEWDQTSRECLFWWFCLDAVADSCELLVAEHTVEWAGEKRQESWSQRLVRSDEGNPLRETRSEWIDPHCQQRYEAGLFQRCTRSFWKLHNSLYRLSVEQMRLRTVQWAVKWKQGFD